MRRILATVAAALLAAGVLGAAGPVAAVPPTPPPADAPSYYPSGPQYDVPVATLESAGWTRCFQEPYTNSGVTTLSSLMSMCDGDYLIVTGRPTGGSNLTILAAAPRADVFTVTAENSPRLVNGSYWYYTPVQDGIAHSMGFSTDAEINQDSCDFPPAPGSLCWHIDGDVNPSLGGGYSLDGMETYEGYIREIYQSLPSEDWSFETSIAASGWNLEVEEGSDFFAEECWDGEFSTGLELFSLGALDPVEGTCVLALAQDGPTSYALWREVPEKGIVAIRHSDACFYFPALLDYASYEPSTSTFRITLATDNIWGAVLEDGTWSYETDYCSDADGNQKFGIDQLSDVPSSWFGDTEENVVKHLLLPTSDQLTEAGDTDGEWQMFEFELDDVESSETDCGALATEICPTISTNASGRLVGAPGTDHTLARATYTWLRCRKEGAAESGPRAPSTCVKISTVKGTAAQLANRPYGVSVRDQRAGFIRLAVKVGTRTFYSGTIDVRP